MRCGPTPGTLSKRARLPNGPCCSRQATIRCASAGPTRGKRVISVTSARSRSMRSPGSSGRANRAAVRAVSRSRRGGGVSVAASRTSPGAAAGRRRVGRGEPHVARRCGGCGSERITHPGACQREAGEQQRGVAVVHGGTVTFRPPAHGIRSMRAAPEKRGSRVRNAECGMRNVSVRIAARLDPSFPFLIPHSAFRIGVTAPTPPPRPRRL